MNSQLYAQDKQYPIPDDILSKIRIKLYSANKEDEGTKRAKNLVHTGYCTYPVLKRLKNFFDTAIPADGVRYELAGGDAMRQFVESTLQSEREKINIQKQNKEVSMPPSAMDNTLNLQKTPRMNVSEAETQGKKSRGALAIIVNEEEKVLIVKRSPFKGSWMPNKHALVGGKIEKNEAPDVAAKRETFEEAGLTLENFEGSFNVLSPDDKVDHVFIAKAPQNQEVKLNNEHTEYNWVALEELKNYDTVPMLYECIELALNKLREKRIYKK
jgi:8-oxo-dGTP pyrophosphatase MutT (NUDIX family)